MLGKTIVAPASAPGRGGVSVIRMSGANAKAIAEDMCGGLAQSWKFRKCKIKSTDGLVLDSGLVVFFESPHSYTGEDVVEFHCHGNPTIVNLIVEDVITTGKSSLECSKLVKENNANIIGYACIIDRSNGKSEINDKIISQVELDIPTYKKDNLPKELLSIEAVKPGSRNL